MDLPVTQNRPHKEFLEGDEGTELLQQHLNLQVGCTKATITLYSPSQKSQAASGYIKKPLDI